MARRTSTRERILDAATDLFGLRGVEAVSLDVIAGEVGVAKQTLLYWFPSKDDLVQAVLESAVLELSVGVEAAIRSTTTSLSLFETRKIQKTLHDQFDDKGKPITVWATEVVNDEKGQPRIANPSPLAKLGIVVTQFSITHVEYDEATKKQFAQKKDAFLAAENSKAQREKEVQERLMVEERGRREKAEAEATALKQKAKEVIDAERLKQVAELDAQRAKNVAEMDAIRNKVVAETDAAKLLAVAQLDKQRAETDAAKQLEVAKLERQAAEENAQKQIALAKAQEESLKIAGAISERDRVLAEIEKEKAIGVAQHLAKVGVPSFIINGGTDAKDGNSTSVNDQLMNVFLLRQMGVLKQ